MSTSISEPKSAVRSSSDLPPPRDRKGLRSVSPPLSKVPIRKFNNYLALFATLVLAFYAWRIIQWKGEVGGWWNLALGKRPPGTRGTQTPGTSFSIGNTQPAGRSGDDTNVEKRINDLAAALGVPSKDLASAIAAAVHEYVPPASLSSVAAHQSGDAVSYLVNPTTTKSLSNQATTGGFQAMADAMEAVVGLDEPPNDMP